MKKHNLKNLLGESLECYYWIGFLMADGHLSKENRLVLTLNTRDEEHVDRFGRFIEFCGEKTKLRNDARGIVCMDNTIVPKIKAKFDIQSDKTHFPPKKLNATGNKLFAMIIGFIDGDGNMVHPDKRKFVNIRIKNHFSWLQIQKDMVNYLIEQFDVDIPEPKINNAGYAQAIISNFAMVKKIKQRALELGLPILERKWNEIDLSVCSSLERTEIIKKKIINLAQDGLDYVEIAEQLGEPRLNVYGHMKRLGILKLRRKHE